MRAGNEKQRTTPARVPYRDLEERLMCNSILDVVSGCWIWIGARDDKGYGRMNMRKAGRLLGLWAHRVAYELFIGPIPEGFQLDHRCRNPPCINPNHCEPVTPAVNRARQAEALWSTESASHQN